jgi:hypothetical protein
METRIQSFRNHNIYKDDLSLDLDVAFMDRVFKPGLESLANSFARVLPKSTLADVQKQLVMAGNPMPYNTFLTLWAVMLLACGSLAFLLLVSGPGALIPNRLGMTVLVLVIGYVFPDVARVSQGQAEGRHQSAARRPRPHHDLRRGRSRPGRRPPARRREVGRPAGRRVAEDAPRRLDGQAPPRGND